MKEKKAYSSMNIIIVAISLLVLVVLLSYFYKSQFGNASDATTETINIDTLEDWVTKKPGETNNDLLAETEESENSQEGGIV